MSCYSLGTRYKSVPCLVWRVPGDPNEARFHSDPVRTIEGYCYGGRRQKVMVPVPKEHEKNNNKHVYGIYIPRRV
jgi:hypothetical protein